MQLDCNLTLELRFLSSSLTVLTILSQNIEEIKSQDPRWETLLSFHFSMLFSLPTSPALMVCSSALKHRIIMELFSAWLKDNNLFRHGHYTWRQHNEGKLKNKKLVLTNAFAPSMNLNFNEQQRRESWIDSVSNSNIHQFNSRTWLCAQCGV